ncbi:MAG: A/G-specific adenine glycosylase, partial [Oscillospiraceae bacterium]|nr:A/G-specific adenine glycosylase [Oscillospiraceae bacterium]
VEAVKERYMRCIDELPDIAALAACDDERLLKLWEGLGYYSRAKNLKKAAQQILENFGGRFPCELSEIRSLIGIGDYTAGAIASIAFGKRAAAVDGNVLRVMARYLPIHEDISSASVKRQLGDKLASVYPQDGDACGSFTQALMELGATVCLPNGAPRCNACPLNASCFAYERNKQSDLPVKKRKQARRKEHKTVLLLRCGEYLALQKRPAEGLLSGMWQLPCFDGCLTEAAIRENLQQLSVQIESLNMHSIKKHIFTHVEWQMYCFVAEVSSEHGAFTWVTPQQLQAEYALPSAFKQFL